MRYYYASPLWLERLDPLSGLCRLGITQAAIDRIGAPIALFYPSYPQELLEAGELLAVIESTKSAIDIEAPCQIAISRCNRELSQNPAPLAKLADRSWLIEGRVSKEAIERHWKAEC